MYDFILASLTDVKYISQLFFIFAVWLCQVLVVTWCSELWHVGSSSLAKDQTQALCIGSLGF